jgi:hypothetical protein
MWTWWRGRAQERAGNGDQDAAVVMLAGFPWWWRAGNLDAAWQFGKLLQVLTTSPAIETPGLVAQTITDRVEGNEPDALTALETILDNTTDAVQLQDTVMKAQPACARAKRLGCAGSSPTSTPPRCTSSGSCSGCPGVTAATTSSSAPPPGTGGHARGSARRRPAPPGARTFACRRTRRGCASRLRRARGAVPAAQERRPGVPRDQGTASETVALAPELARALRAHKAKQAAERLAAANVWEDHDLVWCQENGRPSTRGPTGRSGRTSSPRPAFRTPTCTRCGTRSRRSRSTRASPCRSYRRCSATPISASPATTWTCPRRLHRTPRPESERLFSGRLLRKLLRDVMVGDLHASVCAGQGLSRLSESNRRPVHYE